MMDDSRITITTERFSELIKTEARAEILVDMIERDEFVSKETILRIIGTEKSIEIADRIHKKDKELSFKEMLND